MSFTQIASRHDEAVRLGQKSMSQPHPVAATLLCSLNSKQNNVSDASCPQGGTIPLCRFLHRCIALHCCAGYISHQ